jgi:hypothetical protein
LLSPLVNTDENIYPVYIKRIIARKEEIKKKDKKYDGMSFI